MASVNHNSTEDYQRLFGETPPETPIVILILSDADNTNSFTKADYEDFEFLPLDSM